MTPSLRPVLALLAAFAVAMPAAALQPPQEPPPPPPDNHETQLFRGLFHYHRVTPVESNGKGVRDTIVVICGELRGKTAATADLVRTTLEAGGSVLIASRWDIEDLSAFFPSKGAVRIAGQPATVGTRTDGLGGNVNFPLVRVGLPGTNIEHTIAADNPSFLRLGDSRTRTPPPGALGAYAVRFPNAAYAKTRDPVRGEVYRPLQENEFYAAGGAGPDGNPYRCLVLADSGTFSNRMLYASARKFGDFTPENFQFANEAVKWLTADGTRTKCVFVENGQLKDRFDEFDYTKLPPPGMPPDMPMPPIPNPLDPEVQELVSKVVNGAIAKIEDNNTLPQMLAERPKLYGAMLAGVLAVVLNMALAAAIRSGWRARHRPDYLPPPADPLRLGPDAPLGSFEHRRLEILRGGDFRGPVVAYLRRLFAARGLDVDAAGRQMPAVEASGRNPRQLRHMVRELYDEAFVFDRAPLPYTLWKEIEPAVAAVRAAADAGLWQFRPAPSNAEDA